MPYAGRNMPSFALTQLKSIIDSRYKERVSVEIYYINQDFAVRQGTDFYEGWIVRKGDAFDVISTGKVEKIEEIYTNMYSSGQDLTDHDFYVLTNGDFNLPVSGQSVDFVQTFNVGVAVIPEPDAAILFALGLVIAHRRLGRR